MRDCVVALPRKWVIVSWITLFVQTVFCIVVLYLDLHLDNMESTRIYLGFFQTVIGLFLVCLCLLALHFLWKTFIIFYIVCSIILNLACGIMFILIQVSEDIQFYNDEAPLQPAHTKTWFRLYNNYFILSLTLASFSIIITPIFCKVSGLMKRRQASKSSKSMNVTTNNSDSKQPQANSINCIEEEARAEFKKPLLLKECQISFEPHKGIEPSQKDFINSMMSDCNCDLHSEEVDSHCPYSFPPTGFRDREVRVFKHSDNLRSLDRVKTERVGRKSIKNG